MEAVFASCRDNLIEAADDDVVDDDLEAPSNAIKLSYDIAWLCSINVTQAIGIAQKDKEKGEKIREHTKRFMEMFKFNWSTDVIRRAQHVLHEKEAERCSGATWS